MEDNSLEKKYNKLIIAVSVLIPIVVAILFGVKLKDFGYNVEPLTFLPPISNSPFANLFSWYMPFINSLKHWPA